MKRLFFLAAVCLLLISCGTTRHTAHTEVHVSETTQLAILEETTEITQSETIEVQTSQRDVATEIDETITTTMWSPPDETGQQFPTATIQTQRTTRTQEHENINVQRAETEQTEITETRRDESTIETERIETAETETIREPGVSPRNFWQRFRAWIGGIALTLIVGVIVYKIVKRNFLKQ